jgi:hypothetical protein
LGQLDKLGKFYYDFIALIAKGTQVSVSPAGATLCGKFAGRSALLGEPGTAV